MSDHLFAFWNVENLFGPEDHAPRIPWVADKMRNDLRGWTREIYERKLSQLARIIVQLKGGAGPDILGVCEVEDAHVLADLVALVNTALPARNYAVVHADNERDKRGIDTAFLYDLNQFTVDPDLIFNHFVLRRTGTSDILQATFRSAAGNDIVMLCNHWPSRSGGAIESAGFRATAGETLGYWHQRIREEEGPDTPVLAFGDFNDDPFDPSLKFNAVAWRERGDVERGRSAKFYNLAWEYLKYQVTDIAGVTRWLDGTLYYDGTAKVEAFPEMTSKSVSHGPIRFGLPKGQLDRIDLDGFSDHFPVSVLVREQTAGV